MLDTSTQRPKDTNDTSSHNNNLFGLDEEVNPILMSNYYYFNRKCRRYAKKYNLTVEESFKRLYK